VSQDLVDRVVRAVLYEGYILYPYRPSVKNRQRWTFGGLFPRAYSEAQGGDPWQTQTQCLVTGSEDSRLTISVRFLHLTARMVGVLDHPVAELPAGAEPPFRVVEALQVGDRLVHTWQEVVEREITLGEIRPGALREKACRKPFAFPLSRELEPVRESDGRVVAVLVRHQEPVEGVVEVGAERAGEGLSRLTVRVQNNSALDRVVGLVREKAQMRSFVSTHTILGVKGGAFVSLMDPPEQYRQGAANCHNIGTWPVLVGEAGDRGTMLSSPIILYDYPEVAPESQGDMYDATEIDEILSLRIMTLTEEEKRTMAAVDGRARALLERTERLSPEELQRLHGVMRHLRPGREGRFDG
jgi:hydrogenase maturation protease